MVINLLSNKNNLTINFKSLMDIKKMATILLYHSNDLYFLPKFMLCLNLDSLIN